MMMLFKKQNRNNRCDKFHRRISGSGRCSCFTIIFLLICLLNSLQKATCEPISGTSSAQSSSSVGTASGGTWTIRAIPHQSSTSFSTLYEQVQNLKYNWESSIDHLMRKIEMLESKISRMDTSNQLRLEKLTESVNSKEIKDELAMEQLMRKMDANYERLTHKIGYMEARLDTTLNKMQTNTENGLNRIEARQNDIDTELTDINQSIEEIKSLTVQMDEKHNTTHKSMQQNFQTIISESASRDQIEKLTGTIQHIGVKLNDTNHAASTQNQNQNDASGQSGPDTDRIIQTLKSEVIDESHRIENKISNMYNDLWRRFMSLEMTVKTALTFGNTTRRQIQEDFRTLLQQYDKQRNAEPDSQENYIEIVMDAVMSTVQELTRKVDSNFQMVITSQNLFLDNCHRLQLEEPQLETKISLVLEKILNTITNKTMRFDNRLVETMEMIKSHQSQVMRSLSHTTKMVVTLTEENNQESKNFEAALLELAERNAIVAMTIQELQEDIEMLTNVTSFKLNNEIEDWFNKSLHENYNSNEFDSEEITNKTEEQSTTEPIPPITTTTTINNNNNNNEKSNINYKQIKYADSEEVVKIFTDDDLNNTTENTAKDRKISIVIPNKYYDTTEHNSTINNLTRSKLYKILLQDLLNQTAETINVDDISAVILNTESDKNNNHTNERKNYDDNIMNTSPNYEKQTNATNNKTNLQIQNENPSLGQNFEDSKENLTEMNINPIDHITNTTLNSTNDKNNKSTENENISVTNIENKNNSNINKRKQNITEIIRNKLDNYKNHKYKINNLDLNQNNNNNNRSLLQFLQNSSANNNNNSSLKNLLEQLNKKQKLRYLIKQTNNSSTISSILQNQNESKQPENKNTQTQNENGELQNENTSSVHENKREDIGNGKITEGKEEIHWFPEKLINEQNIIGDTTSHLSDEITISEDNSNFYDTKYPNLETEFSNVYGKDVKEQFPDYDDIKL